ncbi:MAG TPA: CbtA family protein [Nitrososphaera sp.]|nr:CbtA family protein [Nitrososphaera sp.]
MMEHLQTGRAFGLSILSGLIAGGILVGINMTLLQPYTAALAELELENLLAEGEYDEELYDAQLQSIYFSQLYVPIITGLAGGALVGGAYVFSKIRMDPVKAALVIAGIAWFVIYVVPAVKYPPSPEVMFGSEAAGTYQLLLAGYTAVSGLAALGSAFGFSRIKRKEKAFGAAALYLAVVAGAFFAFPDFQSEDDSFLPQPLLAGWRSAISLSMTVFWFALGIITGVLLKQAGKGGAKY